jgi:uncharacterized protein (TIGR02996 family)
MTTPALRQAWQGWCAFADGLDLSDGSPDVAALHGRLFRLSGSHPLRADSLRATRDACRAAFGPWLDASGSAPGGDLERLRRAMAACEPGWRALLGLTARQTDWRDVERVALTAGLAWPAGAFWASPLYAPNQRFDLLLALRGREHAASVALIDALLRVLNHPQGGALFEWARSTPTLTRLADALAAAALFRDSSADGALLEEWLAPLGWADLPGRLLALCQDVCLRLLTRLNEPMSATGGRAAAGARPGASRRAVPGPLPVEPYFRDLPGSAGFLRAVAEEPLEDAHRLAFADWLDEQGHADRARFIRLQCQHDRLPDHPLARRRVAEEIAALFKAHGAAWTAGLPGDVGVEWDDLDNFRRGLLENVHVQYQHYGWGACATMFASADLRGLRTCLSPELLEQPWLGRLLSLELTDYCDAQRLRALASTPALAGLVRLGLTDQWLDTAAFRALAGSLRLPALTSLDVGPCRLRDEGARALADALPPPLRTLKVRGDLSRYSEKYVLSLAGVRALASAPALAGLEHLDLTWNRAGPAGVESLAASPFLANLTTLILDKGDVGTRGAKALAASPFLKRLTCLSLRSTGLGHEAARALAGSPNLAGLAVLDLGDNTRMATAGLRALAASPHLSGLRVLSLAGVALATEEVRALAGLPSMPGLETLDLSNTRLDGPAARALAAWPGLDRLTALDLRQDENTLPPAAKAALRKRWPFARM